MRGNTVLEGIKNAGQTWLVPCGNIRRYRNEKLSSTVDVIGGTALAGSIAEGAFLYSQTVIQIPSLADSGEAVSLYDLSADRFKRVTDQLNELFSTFLNPV